MTFLSLFRPSSLTPLSRSASPVIGACLQRLTQYPYSLKSFDEKERGDEQVYFAKEEQKILQSLLKKMKTLENPQEVASEMQAESSYLKNNFGNKYGISEEDIKKLIDWKYSHMPDVTGAKPAV